jgi:hypothetical protein
MCVFFRDLVTVRKTSRRAFFDGNSVSEIGSLTPHRPHHVNTYADHGQKHTPPSSHPHVDGHRFTAKGTPLAQPPKEEVSCKQLKIAKLLV